MFEAHCTLDKDENVIAILTDFVWVRLTKRDPSTGAELIPSRRVNVWGDLNIQDTLINQILPDLTSSSDGSFYIVGTNYKSAYNLGGLDHTSFSFRFDTALETVWY